MVLRFKKSLANTIQKTMFVTYLQGCSANKKLWERTLKNSHFNSFKFLF